MGSRHGRRVAFDFVENSVSPVAPRAPTDAFSFEQDPMAVTVAQLSLQPASLSAMDAVDLWTNWVEGLSDAAGDGAF